MSEQQAFHDAMAKDPNDATTRLVYADWLEEHGQAEPAKRLRFWASVLPHVIEHAESGDKRIPTGESGLPEWVRQLAIQHVWRNQPMAYQAPHYSEQLRNDERDSYTRMYPNDELHALGLPNDDKGTENLNRVRDISGASEVTQSEPVRRTLKHIARVIRGGSVHLSRVKLAAIQPPGSAGGSVIVRVPTPTPVANKQPTPANSPPIPAQPKQSSSAPVFILPS